MKGKSAAQLCAKLKREREEILARIRIYSEQKLDREAAYWRIKEEILSPIIFELEDVVDYEKSLLQKKKDNETCNQNLTFNP